MSRKDGSSRRWLQRQQRDEYVKRAQQMGYRSRAAFKLLEIDEKDRILRRGLGAVDLGAAPGGWSQVAAQRVGRDGFVIALDCLEMADMIDVTVVQGDFTEEKVLEKITKILGGRGVDLVMSDMSPNITGMRAVDQPRAMYLAELALEFAQQTLTKNGALLVKVFQGEGFDEFRAALQRSFEKVVIRKPKASRAESREMYLLARGFKRLATP